MTFVPYRRGMYNITMEYMYMSAVSCMCGVQLLQNVHDNPTSFVTCTCTDSQMYVNLNTAEHFIFNSCVFFQILAMRKNFAARIFRKLTRTTQ